MTLDSAWDGRTFTDVLILGAGPAGCATALALRRGGVPRVLMLEKASRRPFAIGESASPGVPALLSRLGLDPKLEHLGHLPYYGNLSVWGDAEPAVDDFLRRGLPHGYHLDREAFDRWLREEALAAGAMLCTPVEHIQVERTERRFTVRYQYGGNVVELRAALLVDATGRSAFLARQMGAGIHRSDRLVALALLAEPVETSRLRGLSIVEAFEDGWIYAAGLPGGQCMITVMSDDDIAREGRYREPSVFRALIQNTRHIGPALRLPEEIQVVTAAAASQYSDRAVGAGWIAVGDALIAFDPLTSSGIAGALDDGLSAAATILAWYLSENREEALAASRAYAERAEATLQRYFREHRAWYGREQRFADRAFWARRHAGAYRL